MGGYGEIQDVSRPQKEINNHPSLVRQGERKTSESNNYSLIRSYFEVSTFLSQLEPSRDHHYQPDEHLSTKKLNQENL